MAEYKQIFDMLLTQAEDEVVEFKTAENQLDRDKMGRYFSALSNEANLRDKDFAWLVLGVTNERELKYYRNECLCQAMMNFNMTDTISSCIKTMYAKQRERHFPMPDYQIDNAKQEVNVKIYGKVIDERYAQLLASGTELSLKECIWLDAIQKHKPITKPAIDHLRGRKLIEGKGKEVCISLGVARLTHQVPQYTKNKGLAYDTLLKLILQLAHNAGEDGFMRNDAFETVENALPNTKDRQAKQYYLGRILSKMNSEGLLRKTGRTWYITEKGEIEIRT